MSAAAPSAGCTDDPARRPPSDPPVDAGDDGDAPIKCGAGDALVDGACVPAGVPAGGCGDGFVSENHGCTPVLPPGACGRGTMAVPGERNCRPVAGCGDPPWGDIPVDSGTQYVDGSYRGTDSDGSADRPWTTVQAGIIHAESGGIVAIAEGIYPESPVSGGKPVALWGRCPELVELQSWEQFEALVLDADGAEVHTLALTSKQSFGLFVAGGLGIVVDRVWIHDTADYGFYIAGFLDETEVTVRGSLVERGTAGLVMTSGKATLEETVVRQGVFDPLLGPGRGVDIGDDPDTGIASQAEIRRSVIEENMESGVVVYGSEVTITDTVIRNTLPAADGRFGHGLAVQSSAAPSQVTLNTSVIEGNRSIGLSVVGSTLSMSRSVVSATSPQELDRKFGDGIFALQFGKTELTISESRIADSARAGVANFAATMSIGATVLECNAIQLDGEALGGDYQFEDRGGNACSCGPEAGVCQVVSTNLEPPIAVR